MSYPNGLPLCDVASHRLRVPCEALAGATADAAYVTPHSHGCVETRVRCVWRCAFVMVQFLAVVSGCCLHRLAKVDEAEDSASEED